MLKGSNINKFPKLSRTEVLFGTFSSKLVQEKAVYMVICKIVRIRKIMLVIFPVFVSL